MLLGNKVTLPLIACLGSVLCKKINLVPSLDTLTPPNNDFGAPCSSQGPPSVRTSLDSNFWMNAPISLAARYFGPMAPFS
ncbi:hypothetical protein D3C73_1154310 [compost metagenome]